MKRSRRVLLAAVVITFALSACGSSDKGSASDTSTSAGGGAKLTGKITLAVNPWDGSAANAAVAKAVLEKQGMTVETKDIDENAAWPAVDSGSIDANLEVWPSGHQKDISTYITTKKSVIDGGLIGPTGHIGWYIPKFVADAHPEYKSWEGLKTKAAAKYFGTAESGDKGQFLLGDPSYVSYDAGIIKNLGLPFKVVTGGSEASLITGIGTVFKDKTPLLFYFYNPQWAQAKYDLVSVKLPPVTPACTKAASDPKTYSQYNCDYPTDHLMKAISADLKTKNPAAFKFLENMKWTDKDQNTVTTYKNEDGMTIDQAAQKWVDANQATWQSWLPS